MGFYLSLKEVWRNRGRFLLFSLVIALITTLVLFIAALAEGLSSANREYLSKLDAQLIVFQKNADLSATASQIPWSKLNNIQRIKDVDSLGPIGLSSGSVIIPNKNTRLDVALIGIDYGKPGTPPILSNGLTQKNLRGNVLIDQRIADATGLTIGDKIRIRTIQGADEKYYEIPIGGITVGQQFLFRPSVFLPFDRWDEVRPQAPVQGKKTNELITNIVAVKLSDPTKILEVKQQILNQIDNVDVTDIRTAYEAIPGYKAQQSTLSTQQIFTLLIGVLVIGGFFQIQTLQKVPQIGILKAIGVSNMTIALATTIQIILVTTFGVLIGGAFTLLLALAMPSNVPIVFNGSSVIIAIVSLLLIGPIGGLISIRLAISVEPLTALGLSA
jgi:putative ABC transport system permease protein